MFSNWFALSKIGDFVQSLLNLPVQDWIENFISGYNLNLNHSKSPEYLKDDFTSKISVQADLGSSYHLQLQTLCSLGQEYFYLTL